MNDTERRIVAWLRAEASRKPESTELKWAASAIESGIHEQADDRDARIADLEKALAECVDEEEGLYQLGLDVQHEEDDSPGDWRLSQRPTRSRTTQDVSLI